MTGFRVSEGEGEVEGEGEGEGETEGEGPGEGGRARDRRARQPPLVRTWYDRVCRTCIDEQAGGPGRPS